MSEQEELEDLAEEAEEAEEKAPKYPTEKWRCPNCGMGVTTYVPLNGPPICGNPKKHTTKRIEMEKIN